MRKSPLSQDPWLGKVFYWLGFAWCPLVVVLSGVLASVRAHDSGQPWMVFFEDDFFYYLKVAQNLSHGAGSTFNGLVHTNGYHPLWLLVLTLISRFTTNGTTVFWIVAALCTAASWLTFLLADRFLQRVRLPYVLRRAVAAYIGIYALHLFYTGMEVILAIPLMFLLMDAAMRSGSWRRSPLSAVGLGLLASAAILARLDLVLFCALLLFFAVLNPQVRNAWPWKRVSGFGLGLLPVAGYLLFNHVHFGTWLPVSGLAKQLRSTHWPSGRPWASVYANGPANWINLLPIHLAVIALPFLWKRLSPMQRVVFPAVLLFPFLYILLLSCVSDWQLWLWYLYPMRAALCVSFALFSLVKITGSLLRSPLVSVVMLLLITAEALRSRWWTDVAPPIYAAALDLAGFAQSHPGVYAMGDRSGMVGYLLPYPLVQTEGLVMDRAFLQHIRAEDPLVKTLGQYDVRYYVATSTRPWHGCFHAVEPSQAGSLSAHMTAELCAPPVADFQHEQFRTLVFDLRRQGGE